MAAALGRGDADAVGTLGAQYAQLIQNALLCEKDMALQEEMFRFHRKTLGRFSSLPPSESQARLFAEIISAATHASSATTERAGQGEYASTLQLSQGGLNMHLEPLSSGFHSFAAGGPDRHNGGIAATPTEGLVDGDISGGDDAMDVEATDRLRRKRRALQNVELMAFFQPAPPFAGTTDQKPLYLRGEAESRCLFIGAGGGRSRCLNKSMPLTDFCATHILQVRVLH